MLGRTISHYRILEKLGEGGMGEVFLAQDTSLDRKVALKFLPDFMEEDATARKRFLREAKSAAALDHFILLGTGADVNAKDEKDRSALNWARVTGNDEISSLLTKGTAGRSTTAGSPAAHEKESDKAIPNLEGIQFELPGSFQEMPELSVANRMVAPGRLQFGEGRAFYDPSSANRSFFRVEI